MAITFARRACWRLYSGKWRGILEQPTTATDNPVTDPSDPDSYQSSDGEFKGLCFNGYASAIDMYPDSFFDLVIIDGRSRPSCLKHSVSKVKPLGFLLLDNTERTWYLSRHTLPYLQDYRLALDGFGPTPGASWFTRTTIWERVR